VRHRLAVVDEAAVGGERALLREVLEVVQQQLVLDQGGGGIRAP
jgi:hypothetical protein